MVVIATIMSLFLVQLNVVQQVEAGFAEYEVPFQEDIDADGDPNSSSGKLSLGFSAPLSGIDKIIGNQVFFGTLAYYKSALYKNDAGSDARDIQLKMYDDKGFENLGPSSMIYLSAFSDVQGMIGPVNSGVSLGAAGTGATVGVGNVNCISTNPALADKTKYPLSTRGLPQDEQAASVLAKALYYSGVRRIVVVYQDSEFGRGQMQEIQRIIDEKLGNVSSPVLKAYQQEYENNFLDYVPDPSQSYTAEQKARWQRPYDLLATIPYIRGNVEQLESDLENARDELHGRYYIVCAASSDAKAVFEVATGLDMVNEDYVWVFGESGTDTFFESSEENTGWSDSFVKNNDNRQYLPGLFSINTGCKKTVSTSDPTPNPAYEEFKRSINAETDPAVINPGVDDNAPPLDPDTYTCTQADCTKSYTLATIRTLQRMSDYGVPENCLKYSYAFEISNKEVPSENGTFYVSSNYAQCMMTNLNEFGAYPADLNGDCIWSFAPDPSRPYLAACWKKSNEYLQLRQELLDLAQCDQCGGSYSNPKLDENGVPLCVTGICQMIQDDEDCDWSGPPENYNPLCKTSMLGSEKSYLRVNPWQVYMVLQQIRAEEFEGLTGPFKLDNNGDRAVTADTNIWYLFNSQIADGKSYDDLPSENGKDVTWRQQFTFNTVGEIRMGTATIPGKVTLVANVVLSGRKGELGGYLPPDDQPETIIGLSLWVQITFGTVYGFVILFMLFMLMLFRAYSNQLVIKSSSPKLMYAIILGGFVSYLGSFVLLYAPTNEAACVTFVWLKYFGFAIAFGSLFLKTYRVKKLFNSNLKKSRKRKKLTKQDLGRLQDMRLFIVLAVILLIFAAYLAAWTVVDAVMNNNFIKKVAVNSAMAEYELICQPEGPFQWGMFGIEVAILCYGVVLAYSVHKAPAFFNEAKLIAFAIYNWLLITVLCQVILLLVPERKDAIYVIQVVAILLQIFMSTFFLFGSKLWIVYKGKGNERDKIIDISSKGTVASRIGQGGEDRTTNHHTSRHTSTASVAKHDDLDDSDSDSSVDSSSDGNSSDLGSHTEGIITSQAVFMSNSYDDDMDSKSKDNADKV